MTVKKRSKKTRKKLRTATQRVNESIKNLKARGGTRKSWRLQPDSYQALLYCLEHGIDENETALINRLLIEEQKRIGGG